MKVDVTILPPESSRCWYCVLECPCGCNWTKICIFVFKNPNDGGFARKEAARVLGDCFPPGSLLYPVKGDWLQFFHNILHQYSDYSVMFSDEADMRRFDRYLHGLEEL